MYLKTFGAAHLTGPRLPPQHLLFLAYLVAEGSASRTRLRALFWPHSTSAAASLRVLLSTLRRTAPGLVTERGDRLIVQCSSDLALLLEHIQAGRTSQATALYDGPFLADVSPSLFGAELEEWLIDTREAIAEQLWESLVHAAEHCAGQGRPADATRHAEAAWHLPGLPPRDGHDLQRLHRLLMLSGSPHASRVAREARELGLTVTGPPDQHGPTPVTVPSLPVDVTPFVGHQGRVADLARTLTDPAVRLLTLVGVGGAGKSRLAARVAHAVHQDTNWPVWWVPLEEARHPDDLLAQTALTLGATLLPGRPALDLVTTLLRDAPALIVFDQFEHLDAARIVGQLLERCPHLTVLVTSRHRLTLRAETAAELAGLDLNPPPGQPISDALSLFVSQAKRVRPAYRFTDADLDDSQAVCALLDGLPLAIELAASWTRVLPPREILAALQRDFGLLDTPLPDLPPRHRSMRVVLEQSWQRLTGREQQVLAALAVFHSGFTVPAAAAVADATLHDLQGLVDKSMLRVDVTGRFTRHPLIAQLAWQRLDGQLPLRDLVEARHAAYFQQRSDEGFHEMLSGHRQVEWRNWFHVEYPNLRAALSSAVRRDDVLTAAYLVRNLHREWTNRDLTPVALSTAHAILPALDGPAHVDARVWVLITAEAFSPARPDPDMDALRAARAAGSEHAVLCALYIREFRAYQQGDPAHPDLMTELCRAAERTGRPGTLAIALRRRASVALSQGDGRAARLDLHEALHLVGRLGTTFIQADLRLLLGQVQALQGEYAAAEQSLRSATQMFSILGFRPDASTCMSLLALVHLFRHGPPRPADAAPGAQAWCDQADETFNPQARYTVRDNMNARGFLLTGPDPDAAREWFGRDLQGAQTFGNRQGELLARVGLGYLALRQRHWAEAGDHFTDVVQTSSVLGGHVPARWLALHGLTRVHLGLGDRRSARSVREAAQQLEAGLGGVLPKWSGAAPAPRGVQGDNGGTHSSG